MGTTTYHNDTETAQRIQTPDGFDRTIEPDSRLTFDDEEPNGDQIRDACVAAGLTHAE